MCSCHSCSLSPGRAALAEKDRLLVRPDRVKATGELIYDVQKRGEARVLPQDRVLHIRGLGGDGIVGWSVIRAARESIGLALGAERFGARGLVGQPASS